ncbi:conserved protein of unknown function [Candidatus Filomicrobium marinum]|uniref:Uncharacterized protein n=2 Tax=Filomicrobium TaxID=119044 RepID=A0A0D6JJV3_9HYPH|nr:MULTISPECIES: DUF6165 family protein [Filomicrobium]MCV0371355.1 DUF6165 family protein [Filomicrobium sp.]CFX56235.1 conserved protein of unknown function [Candidatus Filomicrobium marinum]CPR22226.1 conserved protein of unknown function [Candidatus Filomicrobium marinum]SDO91912.1 hypothetical protein SAMN04488061_2002 [Filomicrobium insigne]
MTANVILIPVAPGELIDKITILKIKSERISDSDKLTNVRRELEILRAEQHRHIPNLPQVMEMQTRLENVNGRIWNLEDTIRDCERNKDFGELFLETARAIYRTNDERAAIKKEINLHLGSQIVEEKSYANY